MYQVWSNFLNPGQIAMLGIVVTFLLTFLALKHPFSFLPSDHGREFAVNGGLSRGKLRGVGLVIVICFLIGSVLFLPLGAEYVIYAILLVCIMLSGYLDDASETPWSDYKKGAIDLVISIVTVITFVNYNSTTIYFGSMSLTIPKVVYIIRVQYDFPRCPRKLHRSQLPVRGSASRVPVFQHLAEQHADGRRRFESTWLLHRHPCHAVPPSVLISADGRRDDRRRRNRPCQSIFTPFPENRDPQNTRTPLHDHVRLKYKWSDSQVVIRFVILQILLAVIAYLIVA